jgi:cardiolipin synthase
MRRFLHGNAIDLLRNGREFFPALLEAIEEARHDVWIETYIFADDPSGNMVADALIAAADRGVAVRVLVDGWGARHYLSASLERRLMAGGVRLLKYRPEIAPWQFRSHRLRRLHRKLAQIDGEIGFVGGINVIDDMNTPGHKPPREDFAVRIRGPLLGLIVPKMARLWEIVQAFSLDADRAPERDEATVVARAGNTTAKFIVRDNIAHRRDIERAYLAAIRTSRREILIANAYFFPGVRFRRALIAAAK